MTSATLAAPVVTPYSGCESTRGEWGKPCPDCGVTLPRKRRSNEPWTWMAQRSSQFASNAPEVTFCGVLDPDTDRPCMRNAGHDGNHGRRAAA